MALASASVGRLASVLTDPTYRRVILAGAGVSACEPSCLPDAASLVARVSGILADRAGFEPSSSLELLTMIDGATNRLAVPLETLLATLDAASADLGARIAATVAEGVPHNGLHVLLAEIAARGNAQLVTSNFDVLLEQAYQAIGAGPIRRWIVDDGPLDSDALLFKVHGSADHLHTLRHNLQRVNRPLDSESLDGLRNVMSSAVVILGYAGADFDITEMLEGVRHASGPVYWLVMPGRIPFQSAAHISDGRDVYLVEGSFEKLCRELGRPSPEYRPDGRHVWPKVSAELSSLGSFDSSEVLADVLYQARVAQPSTAPLYNEFRQHLRRGKGRAYRKLYHRAQAAESQFIGGAGPGLLRACLHFILAASPGSRWRALSDAAEALERVAYGILAPILRLFSWPIHAIAARKANGVDRARLRLRFVHSLNPVMSPRATLRLLVGVLRDTDNDTYLEGAVYLRMAVAAALADSGSWEHYIAKAQRDFVFEGRTVEFGDSLKLAAACMFISGQAARAYQLLDDAESYQEQHGQAVGAIQASILRNAMQRFPRLSRLVIRYI